MQWLLLLFAHTYLITEPSTHLAQALEKRLAKQHHVIMLEEEQQLADVGDIDGLILITPAPPWHRSLFPEEQQWLTLFQTCFTSPLELLKKSLIHFPEKGHVIIIPQIPQDPILRVLRTMWLAEAESLAPTLTPLGLKVTLLSEEKADALICNALELTHGRHLFSWKNPKRTRNLR